MCCFFGGIGRVEQHFNVTAAQTTASLPAPAGGSLIIPMAFYQLTPTTDGGKASSLSRGTSVFLLITYGCYLLFQLKARVEIYNRPSPKTGKRCQRIAKGDSKCRNDQIAKMAAASMEVNAQQAQMQDRDDEPEQLQLTILVALITRDVLPAIVAVYAEFMVSSIDALPATGDIGRTFVGPVLLHEMDIAIGIAVGSDIQIALEVLPWIVVPGWAMGRGPDFTVIVGVKFNDFLASVRNFLFCNNSILTTNTSAVPSFDLPEPPSLHLPASRITMASTRRSGLVSNINCAPDFITTIENSASKLAGCYGFPTTTSQHKTYSLDPNFKHSRDIIDQFAADRANSFDNPNLSAGQKQIRFSIFKHAFDNALKWS
ncbi:hypothetical protein PENANT_c193G03818 [Penicillium antarcticum]|uniref:Uncharacterized protein n=1 Tax=Penicillium antarcticum TaxID=416450 RepID=A0A1V6PAH2_9EURO|nr:hypothetical protein PENANT_c193G03818 [Penicillium antarcticum]